MRSGADVLHPEPLTRPLIFPAPIIPRPPPPPPGAPSQEATEWLNSHQDKALGIVLL